MVDQDKRERPKKSIDYAIIRLKARDGSVIVEIGSMRGPLTHDVDDLGHPCCNDGHSSVLWARTGLEFHTVDYSAQCFGVTKSAMATGGYANASVYNMDGVAFLESFEKPIDLLYLDAWDVDLEDSPIKHLLAFRAAKKNLHKKSMVLIDDTDVFLKDGELFENSEGLSGKGSLLIPEAESEGYNILRKGRQTLLSKQVEDG